MKIQPTIRVASLLVFLGFSLARSFAASPGKARIAMISFGDYLEYQTDYYSKSTIEESFRKLKDAGFTAIYWRLQWEGAPENQIDIYSWRVLPQLAKIQKEFENTPYSWDESGYELKWPVEVAHRLGIKLYAWIVPYNMGAPPGAYAELGVEPSRTTIDAAHQTHVPEFPPSSVIETQFPYMFEFVREHPQYQLVDRAGKRHHYGVLEWAYPEARQYWTGLMSRILDAYDVDGIYMDTRTECMAPDYADQFGFNDPIVDEYRRRYGTDIRTNDFDLEEWRQLRGEYFTLFLKESSEVVHGKGKQFSLGTARGDYIGFPLGNMRLEWQKWISQHIVDEIHFDERGWAWGRHGFGYLTDRDTERGLRPIDEMVKESYGPLCKHYGVKLYVKPALYTMQDEAWKTSVTQMPEFDGIIEPNLEKGKFSHLY